MTAITEGTATAPNLTEYQYSSTCNRKFCPFHNIRGPKRDHIRYGPIGSLDLRNTRWKYNGTYEENITQLFERRKNPLRPYS